MAKESTAIFARTQFIESVGRYERLFKQNPPTIIAQFTERVPIIKGRLSANASTATSYAWFIWESSQRRVPKFKTEVQWIPPTRTKLERPADYEESVATPHPRPTSRHASRIIRKPKKIILKYKYFLTEIHLRLIRKKLLKSEKQKLINKANKNNRF